MAKRRKQSSILDLLELTILLIIILIKIFINLMVLIYDFITIYTTKYKQKSGNGFFRTYFNKGNYGEFKLYRKIKNKFGNEYIFTNIYLDSSNTDKTEIDVIGIAKEGIYVFEMKNYSGYIFGSEYDEYWTQVLNKFSKNKFYNPIRQNYAHTKAIEKELLIDKTNIIPVVIFSNYVKLSKINVNKEMNVFKLSKVNTFINKTRNNRKIVFNEKEIKEFSIKLIECSNMSEEVKEEHINQVKELKEVYR